MIETLSLPFVSCRLTVSSCLVVTITCWYPMIAVIGMECCIKAKRISQSCALLFWMLADSSMDASRVGVLGLVQSGTTSVVSPPNNIAIKV